MEIIQSILDKNPCYKAGKKIRVKGLMLHSVGCPQPSAEVFVKKWNNPESARACVHAFIDGPTGKVYRTLPWDHRAWHCGGSGNNTHIGVEMCEPACIRYTGGATFICLDEETALALVKRTYDSAVELFAFLCRKFGLEPGKDGVIVSHKEGHSRGIASGHGDPEHLWEQLKTGYTMNGFREAVRRRLEEGESVTHAEDDLVYAPLHALAKSNHRLRAQVLASIKAMGTTRQNGQEEMIHLNNINIAYDQIRTETEGILRLTDLLSANQMVKRLDTTPLVLNGNLGSDDQKNARLEVGEMKKK